mmetsp:Transcript_6634/g.11582  ORF Transcript_6634/g.11582 Transcript_6634/m.11582 type:complete len:208 (-) Transcript_6634:43-666(-)
MSCEQGFQILYVHGSNFRLCWWLFSTAWYMNIITQVKILDRERHDGWILFSGVSIRLEACQVENQVGRQFEQLITFHLSFPILRKSIRERNTIEFLQDIHQRLLRNHKSAILITKQRFLGNIQSQLQKMCLGRCPHHCLWFVFVRLQVLWCQWCLRLIGFLVAPSPIILFFASLVVAFISWFCHCGHLDLSLEYLMNDAGARFPSAA